MLIYHVAKLLKTNTENNCDDNYVDDDDGHGDRIGKSCLLGTSQVSLELEMAQLNKKNKANEGTDVCCSAFKSNSINLADERRPN